MDNKKNGIPKLRFPGFTGAWEQRKLGEVVERFDNLRIPVTSSKREKGITPYYGANGIQDYVQGYTHDGEFVLVAEDGANDLQNYPVHYVNGKVWVNNHAHVLQGKKDIADNLFLVNAIKRIKFETYLVGGSRAKLNADVMMKLPIKVPTLNEQQKLGKYFSRIDSLIALHQRKLEHLQEQKKGLLQKMFPKNGETVPEVRFPGFTDAWEQRKLGEVVERFDNLRIPVTSSKREKGITPYYGANGIQDYVQGYTHDGEFVLVAEDGANDLQNYPVHYVNGKVWVNNHAHVLQGKKDIADNLFLVNAIKRIKFETYLVGGSRAKLNADVMMKLPIKVPTLNEQQKLGKYFSRIDSLIALHQRKLEHLELMKKGLLQQMFV
ncbi:restriction endonuclease subunit S [Ligilactobacillus salivarius]|uniref:restriction endonuclease subunit S n=1 Tax=Ligilactobacillus salivarius TaxID=1624 RepID=UPI002151CA52|nr:restriction endonuclease subunit S [Ligilactobacillus salivarius]MDH4959650.1 restriction endonuclease subunit S [Ligilactobacillus salivarius]UUY23561.1 restriction endonuclease subunit S [Ligilactobacillus salivarius]